MNANFESIVWLSGHFGIIIREQVEKLVYHNKYSYISANRTLSKLEKEHGLLKRIDRGKRKTDGYKLTNEGAKYFRRLYGYEPKIYSSGDKLNHSIQILNFYISIVKDMEHRGILKDDYNIIEEKRNLYFNVQKQLEYQVKDKMQTFIPDGFGIYYFAERRAKVFYLEIENSNRMPSYVAQKTLKNYEGYFLSGKWKKDFWQPKDRFIFPYILIVSYSDFKSKELIKHFKKKMKVPQLENFYLFTDYVSLKEGFSNNIWYNMKGERVSLF